jgi:hypothetical protein
MSGQGEAKSSSDAEPAAAPAPAAAAAAAPAPDAAPAPADGIEFMINNMNFKTPGEFELIDFGSLELEINKLTGFPEDGLNIDNINNIFGYFNEYYKRLIDVSYEDKKKLQEILNKRHEKLKEKFTKPAESLKRIEEIRAESMIGGKRNREAGPNKLFEYLFNFDLSPGISIRQILERPKPPGNSGQCWKAYGDNVKPGGYGNPPLWSKGERDTPMNCYICHANLTLKEETPSDMQCEHGFPYSEAQLFYYLICNAYTPKDDDPEVRRRFNEIVMREYYPVCTTCNCNPYKSSLRILKINPEWLNNQNVKPIVQLDINSLNEIVKSKRDTVTPEPVLNFEQRKQNIEAVFAPIVNSINGFLEEKYNTHVKLLQFLILKYFIFFYGDILNKINTVLIGGENIDKKEKKRKKINIIFSKNINRLVSFGKKILRIEKKFKEEKKEKEEAAAEAVKAVENIQSKRARKKQLDAAAEAAAVAEKAKTKLKGVIDYLKKQKSKISVILQNVSKGGETLTPDGIATKVKEGIENENYAEQFNLQNSTERNKFFSDINAIGIDIDGMLGAVMTGGSDDDLDMNLNDDAPPAAGAGEGEAKDAAPDEETVIINLLFLNLITQSIDDSDLTGDEYPEKVGVNILDKIREFIIYADEIDADLKNDIIATMKQLQTDVHTIEEIKEESKKCNPEIIDLTGDTAMVQQSIEAYFCKTDNNEKINNKDEFKELINDWGAVELSNKLVQKKMSYYLLKSEDKCRSFAEVGVSRSGKEEEVDETCRRCGQVVKKGDNIIAIYSSVNEPLPEAWICSTCFKSEDYVNSIHKFVPDRRGESKGGYICKICGNSVQDDRHKVPQHRGGKKRKKTKRKRKRKKKTKRKKKRKKKTKRRRKKKKKTKKKR